MKRISSHLAAALFALAMTAAPAAAGPADVLPDLDQVTPTGLQVSSKLVKGKRVFRLGFASASANIGPGALFVHGFRPNTQTPTMQVNQIVRQTDGSARLRRGVGTMSYAIHPDHRHWHYLGFERYELRIPGVDKRSVRRDRKTGFCLGDRFPLDQAPTIPGYNPTPRHGDECGLGEQDALGMFVGMSTGYVDRYEAQIEGQYIDITGAPSRNYVLVHTVNPGNRLLESNYSNNSASVLFSLNWRRGRNREPTIRVLRKCPTSASCPG